MSTSAAEQRPEPLELTLQVTGGLHVGGAIELSEGSMTVVGSGVSCDFILADDGVAERHCLILVHGGRISVRALDAELECDGQVLSPPATTVLDATNVLRLGGAEITLTRRVDDHAIGDSEPSGADPAAAATDGSPAGPRPRRLARAVLSTTAITLCLVAAIAIGTGTWSAASTEHGNTGGDGAEAPTTGEVAAHARGEATTASATDAGGRDADQARPDPTGAAIAANVRDVLRLSGISARTEYAGDGTVKVIGRQGDGKAVQKAVRSRAMFAVHGLERVVVLNEDTPSAKPGAPEPVDAPRRNVVARVVGGDDPYLILEDGSRVYPGVGLASGATLAGIERGLGIIVRDGRERRVDLVGKTLNELDTE